MKRYKQARAIDYCKFGNFREGLISRYFAYAMRSFAKRKPPRNDEITLSFTVIGKSCLSRENLTPQICLLTLFAKIKFSRKFPNLQYNKARGYKTFVIQLSITFYLKALSGK